MNRIFYGLAGEGLGHASRALSIIDALPSHEIHIYTFGKAHEYFKKLEYPHLHLINGIMFPYHKGKINYPRLIWKAAKYWYNELDKNINQICSDAESLHPDLFISDFEPSMPRASKALRKKYLSIDNQHRFACCDLSDLPLSLRLYANLVGLTTRLLVPRPAEIIISTFHYDILATSRPNVTLANGLLREELTIPSTNYNHILIYLRDSVNVAILNSIKNLPNNFKIYGSNDCELKRELEKKPNFEFKPLGKSFIKDLKECEKVISTAGNQLIGETRYCQKPILVIPEPLQYEQYINAYYVNKLGLGICCKKENLTTEVVENFINKFKLSASREDNGVYKITDVIRRFL